MGYESKVFVIERSEIVPLNGMKPYVLGIEIARFDLCKMGYDMVDGRMFPSIFDVPIDFMLYNPVEDVVETQEDCYGEHCGMTSVECVIEWLEKAPEDMRTYRRAALFLDFLYALREREHEYDGEIVLVHYGY